jgi:hypothetical protein
MGSVAFQEATDLSAITFNTFRIATDRFRIVMWIVGGYE